MAPSTLRPIYRSRRDCIKKKTEELAILCDVDAFAIIIGPDGRDLTTWPENHSQLKSVIAKYRNQSGGNQAKKDPETKKKKWVLSDWDDSWLDGLVGDSLLDFSNSVRVKIEQVKQRAEALKSVDRGKIQQLNPNDQLFVNTMEINAETETLFNQTMMFGDGENWGFTFTPQQANPNDQLFVNAMEIHAETEPLFNQTVMFGDGENGGFTFTQQQENPNYQLSINAIHAETEPFGNEENGGFTFIQQQANPNGWVNFLQNGETNPSFSWIVNGEETPNCWVGGEEPIGQLRVDLVNGTGTKQFPQTNTSCCVDNIGCFQTGPSCGFMSKGGGHNNLEAFANSFGYGCNNNITGQQQYSNSSGYDYGMYDHQHPAIVSSLPQFGYGGFADGTASGSSSSVWL